MRYIIALALCALIVLPASAAGPPKYKQSTLRLPGRLLNAVTADLDGDGLDDVTAFCMDAASKGGKARPARVAAVFYQGKDGGFDGKPAQSWTLPADAVACDVGAAGPAGSGGRRSPAYIAPDGVYAFLPKGNSRAGGYDTRPTRLIKAASVFVQADPLDMPRWPFFTDNGKGGPDALLVPGIDRVDVFEPGNGGYVLAGTLGLDGSNTTFAQGYKEGSDSSLSLVLRVPVVLRTDFSGKGVREVVVAWDDNADVWMRKPGGGYAAKPDIRFRPGLLDKNDKDSVEGAWLKPVDLDGDGAGDLVVTKKAGSVAHTRSLLFVYMRKKSGGFPEKPDKTIITEGVVGPRFVDFDGDGRRDILLPSIKLGISNFINMLTTKQVSVNLAIYLQDGSGSYPDTPTKEKAVKFKLDIANLGKKAAPVLETGKFTKGPGYGLLAVTKSDEVSIYLPDKYSMLSDKPGVELKVDAPTGVDLADVNGDGIDDIVMTYEGVEGKDGIVNVFVSR